MLPLTNYNQSVMYLMIALLDDTDSYIVRLAYSYGILRDVLAMWYKLKDHMNARFNASILFSLICSRVPREPPPPPSPPHYQSSRPATAHL